MVCRFSTTISSGGRLPLALPNWAPGSRLHVSRSEEHTSELQSLRHLVCRLLLEKKKSTNTKLVLLLHTGSSTVAVQTRDSDHRHRPSSPHATCSYLMRIVIMNFFFFFFNDTATTEIYTLSLHDALPIYSTPRPPAACHASTFSCRSSIRRSEEHTSELQSLRHLVCRLLLEKKKKNT